MSDENNTSSGSQSDDLSADSSATKRPRKKAVKRAKPDPAQAQPSDEASAKVVEAKPDPESRGGQDQSSSKSQRRRRSKGKSNQHAATDGNAEPQSNDNPSTDAGGNQQRRSPRAKSKHDPELCAKHAWKIYLAEISEEGVVLVDDQSAKELARRCFKLTEIFFDEQSSRY